MGGAEIVAFREARALLSRGHRVVVLSGVASSDIARPGILTFDIHEGIPVYRISLRMLSADSDFFWASTARRLRAIISSHDIEAVHFHNVRGLGANLVPAAKSMGLRCVMTLHDHWGFCYRATLLRDGGAICANSEECSGCQHSITTDQHNRLPMRVRRDYVTWCVKQADRLICPSSSLASAYRQAGFPSERLVVLSNGIDVREICAGPKKASCDGAVRFLWSGYLGEHKGIFILLDALRQLAKEPEIFQRCHVRIAGDGHLRAEVEAEVKSRNLRKQVEFLGRVSRPTLLNLLQTTDVCVLTSIWPENEPVTLLEAIASGTATIATNLGGSTDLVEDGRSGLVVQPGSVSALANAMRRYILDPSVAVAHGMRNLERRSSFDETRTIDALEQLLTGPQDIKPIDGEPIIITGGSASPPEEAGIVMQHLYDHLLPGRTPRFIWHEWACRQMCANASLFWLWDAWPAESLINLALHAGVPVLAPISDWTEGLARHYGAVIVYKTYLEALATLRSLLSNPPLMAEFSTYARAGSAAATILSPRRAFELRSGATI